MHESDGSSPEPESRLRPGDTLGRYQLLVPVGAGGMGRVWAARALGPRPAQRLVAIKTALGDEQANQEFNRLFMDEARIASLIQHPNVCSIHALDEENGIVYLVMDWSDGATLRELLDAVPDHRLQPAVAARLVAGVAAGLHAAHELEDADGQPLNVVHRDVSPQNVLISAQGHPRIADFGVAKARGQLHQATATGEVKGKLSYMAPEQVTSKNIDRRVDVFALGCVLYEATVGRRPFHGEDALATLYQLLERPVVGPSEVCSDYPPELEVVVLTALAKDIESRYQTAAQMGHALEAWIASTGRVVTEKDVEAVLKGALGPLIHNRNQRIQGTVRKLDRKEEVEEPSGPGHSVDTNRPSVRTLAGEPTAVSPRHFWTGRTAAVAVLVALIAVAFVLGLGRWNKRASHASLAQPHVVASPEVNPLTTRGAATKDSSNPAPSRSVSITLRAQPAEAGLYLDGERVTNPFSTTVPASSVAHTVRADAPRYRELSQTLVFDRDHSVVLTLARDRITNASPQTQPRAPQPRGATADAGRAQNKPERRPRELDRDNPFATP